MQNGDRIIVNGIDTPYVIGDEIQFHNITYVIKNGTGLNWPNRDKLKKYKFMGDLPVHTDGKTVWRFLYGDGSVDDGEWLVKIWLDLKINGKIFKEENTWIFVRLYNFG